MDKGLSGEQAGTSLRMALIRLAKPPKQARKALDKLGLSVTDSHKKFKSLTQISKEWIKSTEKMTQAEKVKYAAEVFGVEAATGMLNLFASGPKKINEMTKALEASGGSAKKAAKAMKDNYAGALERLKGSVETAQISFATPILPVFQEAFDGLGTIINKNMGSIEKAGKRTANALRDIFEPISMKKPVMPKLLPSGNRLMDDGNTYNQYLTSKYQQDLNKYNKFSKMDFGDKVVYMLDEAADKMEKWLSGSGGESMNKIFTKLGEIAAKAWWAAFEGTVKSASSNFAQGNFAAAGGMGALAWILGGGMMVKGAVGAGKWGIGKLKGRPRAGAAAATTVTETPAVSTASAGTASTGAAARSTRNAGPTSAGRANRGRRLTTAQRIAAGEIGAGSTASATTTAAAETTSTTSRVLSGLAKGAKVLSKIALPLSVAIEGFNIYKSNDKTKATAQAAGGIGGSIAGAQIGAAIGTAIVPGIGTAIGGALGGLGGYVAGKWGAGKVVDSTRAASKGTTTSSAATAQTGNTTIDTSAVNTAIQTLVTNVQLTSNNFSTLTMYTGQASGWIVGSFTGVKTSADTVKFNMDMLASYTGQASGWLASLNGIQSAGQRVVAALNNLEARINSVKLPSSKSRVSYNG